MSSETLESEASDPAALHAAPSTSSSHSHGYEIDDHVYVSPPYSKRSGEPYLVARILDFPKAKAGEAAQVKLAFYLRPRDISSRYIADHRVLLATMHADESPLSFIRGRCRVHHRDRLPGDLEVYKREPDSFWYHQLYDRYLHRYFDLIPTERVQNAPPDALAHLNEHFEFVACEVGMGHELSDSVRGCTECHKWASNAESVACAMCRRIWHLQCVDPPLPKRPTAGYGWSCATCATRHEEDIVKFKASGDATLKPSAAKRDVNFKRAPAPRAARDASAAHSANGKLKQTHGWPFRYFGQHSDPTTITDPHDSFYPRASTRVGHKFQISAIYLEGEADPADRPRRRGWNLAVKRERSGLPKFDSTMHRGGDDTIQLISKPPETSEAGDRMESILEVARTADIYKQAGVRLLDRALAMLVAPNKPASPPPPEETKGMHTEAHPFDLRLRIASVTLKDLGIAEWSEAEIEKFNELVEDREDDLEDIAQTLPRKKIRDVVDWYYLTRPDMENKIDEQHDDDKWADGVAPTGLTTEGAATGANHDDESVAGEAPEDDPESIGPCAVCEATTSPIWWKCPSGIGLSQYRSDDKVMCKDCSVQWRRYGSDSPLVPEDPVLKKAAAKRQRAALKQVDIPNEVLPRLPPPPPPKPVAIPKPCVMCKRMDPRVNLATCSRCSLSGHFVCCGIEAESYHDDWLCLMCKQYDILRRPHPHSFCAVCPPRRLKSGNDPLNALDLFKPTVDNGFVHLICALLHPDINFVDTTYMQPCEGAIAIPAAKWTKECFVCNQSDTGACVKCADCNRHFHVSCAWQSGCKFAFEIQPVKKKKQVQQMSVSFKTESGALEAKIWCRAHKLKAGRIVYEFNEKDPETKLTALQTFVQNYKTAKPPDSFPLIRRALRLDNLVMPALQPERSQDPLSPLVAVSAVAALDMPLLSGGRQKMPKAKHVAVPPLSASASHNGVSKSDTRSRGATRSKSRGKAKAKPKPRVKSLSLIARPPPPTWEEEKVIDNERTALHSDAEDAAVPTPYDSPIPTKSHGSTSSAPYTPQPLPAYETVEEPAYPLASFDWAEAGNGRLSESESSAAEDGDKDDDYVDGPRRRASSGHRKISNVASRANGSTAESSVATTLQDAPMTKSVAHNYPTNGEPSDITSRSEAVPEAERQHYSMPDGDHSVPFDQFHSTANGFYQFYDPYQPIGDASFYPIATDGAYDHESAFEAPADMDLDRSETPEGTARLSKAASGMRRKRSPIPADASCFNCGTAETPVWRRDDENHILCNSCGQYWKAHRKQRPLNLKGPKRIIHKYAPQGRPPIPPPPSSRVYKALQAQQRTTGSPSPLPHHTGLPPQQSSSADMSPFGQSGSTYHDAPIINPFGNQNDPDTQTFNGSYPSVAYQTDPAATVYGYHQSYPPPQTDKNGDIAVDPSLMDTAEGNPQSPSAEGYEPDGRSFGDRVTDSGGKDAQGIEVDPSLLSSAASDVPDGSPAISIPAAWGHQFQAVFER